MRRPYLLIVCLYLVAIGFLGVHGLKARGHVLAPRSTAAPRAVSLIPSPTSALVLASPLPVSVPTPLPSPTATPAPVLPPSTSKAVAHILMYHYIRTVDPAKDRLGYNLSITPANFDQQVQAMVNAGYHFITMAEVMAGKGGPRAVALTFDDGYEDFYTDAWPVLKKYNAVATAYIISNKIGGQYMSWDQIREIQAAGIEIGAHTENHRDLSKLSAADQQTEIMGSKAAIEAQVGKPVVSFCYPSGKYNDDSVRIVQAAGFSSATTTKPGIVYSLGTPLVLPRLRVEPSLRLSTLEEELSR